MNAEAADGRRVSLRTRSAVLHARFAEVACALELHHARDAALRNLCEETLGI